MTQGDLLAIVELKPAVTMVDRLAQFFHARPNQWIDGRELAKIAGYAAWRTRVADCRRLPYGMTIENRTYRQWLDDGRTITVSEYRFLPGGTT